MNLRELLGVNIPMKSKYLCISFCFVLIFCSCTGNNTKTYHNAEEELCAILEEEGWSLISNCTNVYRRDVDYGESTSNKRSYKTTYWYTASIYCKSIGDYTKYIVARPVYMDREEDRVYRNGDGTMQYKTFSIVECNYTDKYGTHYNGYISDGGSTAYLNF